MNQEGSFLYAPPFPSDGPRWYGPAHPTQPEAPVQPFLPVPATLVSYGLSPEDRALLRRIEEKLDAVNKKLDALRTDGILAIMPGDEKRADDVVAKRVGEQVDEIRRRVREALGEKT